MFEKIKKWIALLASLISKKEKEGAEEAVKRLARAIPPMGMALVKKGKNAILVKKYDETTIFYGATAEGQLCPLVKVRNGEVKEVKRGDTEKVARIILDPSYLVVGSWESTIKIVGQLK